MINVFVSIALIHLYLHPFDVKRNPSQWAPPFRATLPVVIFFLLSNIYLVAAPFVPPSDGQSVYNDLPYYLHCVVGIGIFVAGAIYWVIWAQILPRVGRYQLVKKTFVGADGWSKSVFERVKNQ